MNLATFKRFYLTLLIVFYMVTAGRIAIRKECVY